MNYGSAKKKSASSMSKQESAQSKRGGTQPSGKKWYLSGPNDRLNSDGMPTKSGGFRYLYTATPTTKKPGSVAAPKGRATMVAGNKAMGISKSRNAKSTYSAKAASPAARPSKRAAERSEPRRGMLRKKSK